MEGEGIGMIRVIQPGLFTTIQDLGRVGYQKYGVVVGGAMDLFACRVTNLLVGNEPTAAVLEATLLGPTLQFDKDLLIALGGADLSPTLDGEPLPLWRPIYVRAGSILRFGKSRFGCRLYLAVAGGFDLPYILDSYSTYVRGKFGGLSGRALQSGDELPVKIDETHQWMWRDRWAATNGRSFVVGERSIHRRIFPHYQRNPVIRFIRGRQYDWFDQKSKQRLIESGYRVSPQSDRMGYRLEGEALSLEKPREMLSEAVTFGTIQVPKDGQPIVLMADRQTTGGYPKIAQVIYVDLPVLAQVKPGETVRFAEVSKEEAEELYLNQETALRILQRLPAIRS